MDKTEVGMVIDRPSMNDPGWIAVKDAEPQPGELVWTKIHRTETPPLTFSGTVDDYAQIYKLRYRTRSSGPGWWMPDMSMYVYYTPTHWRR